MMIIAVLLAGATLRAQDVSERPYATIVSRNMFGLVPIPPSPPAEPPVEVDPPPKIAINGIMSIFGNLQVLFKVTPKAKPGQPVVDEAYTMSEGERQDEIEVTKIDQSAGTVTFNNHGIEQTLTLELAKGATGGGPAGGPGGPGGAPGMRPGFGIRPGGGPSGPGGFGMPPANRNATTPGSGNPSVPSVGEASTGNNSAKNMTPEDQVINQLAQMNQIEDNRIATQEAVDKGLAFPLPPTPFTPQDATAAGGSPLVVPDEPVAPHKK